MRVAVVGAGIAGLAAARELTQSGSEVVIFEKSGRVGGRIRIESVDQFVFDMGATSVAPRGRAIENVLLNELSQEGLVKIAKPIWTMAYGRVSPGEASHVNIERYCFEAGMDELPKRLTVGLDVRLNCDAGTIHADGDRWIVAEEVFDAVILSMSVTEAQQFIHRSQLNRYVPNARYRACLSVGLGYAFADPEVNYHALVEPEQRSPVIWFSFESVKCSGRAPEGQCAIVAQFGPQYSADHFEDSESEIAHEAYVSLARILGDKYLTPSTYKITRWRYSQPESIVNFESANPAGSKLLLAGDGLLGARVELAYETGVMAARRLLG